MVETQEYILSSQRKEISETSELNAFIVGCFNKTSDRFWSLYSDYRVGKATEQNIVKFISKDYAKVEKILYIANLPALGGDGHIDSIKQAILNLGTPRVISIALSIAAMDMFPVEDNNTKKIWQHNYQTAIIADALSYQYLKTPCCWSFLAGFMHDMGKIILSKYRPNPELYLPEEDTFLQYEKRIYGNTHPEVGAWFAEAANLPEGVITAIKHHHAHDSAGEYSYICKIIAYARPLMRIFVGDREGELNDYAYSRTQMPISEIVLNSRISAHNFFNGDYLTDPVLQVDKRTDKRGKNSVYTTEERQAVLDGYKGYGNKITPAISYRDMIKGWGRDLLR